MSAANLAGHLQRFFTDRLPAMKAEEAATLTPANWLKARQAAAKANA